MRLMHMHMHAPAAFPGSSPNSTNNNIVRAHGSEVYRLARFYFASLENLIKIA